MQYIINFTNYASVFAVPASVVDEHLRMCGVTSLKALLMILRNAPNPIEPVQLAARLSLPVGDLHDALTYWVDRGVLSRIDSNGALESTQSEPVETAAAASYPQAIPVSQPPKKPTDSVHPLPDSGDRKIYLLSDSPPRLSGEEAAQLRRDDPEIQALIDELQLRTGRPMTIDAMSSIVSLYNWAGLSADYILLIAEYCHSIGKNNTRYVVKTILNWLEREIDTYEKAEAHIIELTEQAKVEQKILQLLGLDTKLNSKDRQFCTLWVNQYRMEDGLIKKAFEMTLEAIQKPSFAYMNRILTGWHEDNITTVQQLCSSPKSGQSPAASYDINELERTLIYGGAVDRSQI